MQIFDGGQKYDLGFAKYFLPYLQMSKNVSNELQEVVKSGQSNIITSLPKYLLEV